MPVAISSSPRARAFSGSGRATKPPAPRWKGAAVARVCAKAGRALRGHSQHQRHRRPRRQRGLPRTFMPLVARHAKQVVRGTALAPKRPVQRLMPEQLTPSITRQLPPAVRCAGIGNFSEVCGARNGADHLASPTATRIGGGAGAAVGGPEPRLGAAALARRSRRWAAGRAGAAVRACHSRFIDYLSAGALWGLWLLVMLAGLLVGAGAAGLVASG